MRLKFYSTNSLIIASLFAAFVPYAAQGNNHEIRWRSGVARTTVQSVQELEANLADIAARTAVRHFVVQFDAPIDSLKRTDLKQKGITLGTYLGNHAFIASRTEQGFDGTDLARFPSLISVQPLLRAHKVHPFLLAGNVPTWAVVSTEEGVAQANHPVVGLYVLFHADVALVPDALAIVERHGAVVRNRLESVNGLVIEMPFAQIMPLADNDEILWIEQPLPRFETVNDSNRALTGANTVQSAPYNLDGSGVRVLVYDGGSMFPDHPDLEGRIVNPLDNSGVIDHATHVAGTIGGTGEASGGQFRGMAPGVDFVSFGFQWEPGSVFLYTDPGDIEQDYGDAITQYGAHIANNSIGTNTCWNGFPCEITGDYGVTDSIIDQIVAGFFGAPFRVVWANGNERNCPFCPGEHTPENGYHSAAPPACAKNHLSVGALNSNDDSMTDFSSWGPCDDGRLKPDVAAPGCQSNGDGGVTSCAGFGYVSFCGTSMASPTACGIGALLLEDFRVQFPERVDFRNSTLRAMMAHTADDWGLDDGLLGPDYRSGYGSVRAPAAVDFLRTGNFLEAEVDQGGTYSVLVIVNPGDPHMKVTIAWDDPFSVPLVESALINDLDLVVYDPSSEQRYPWTLDPANPELPAVRTQADRVNNIEQVFVENAEPGVWRVEVHGFNVPQGPQTFSLCGSPMVVNCSTRGVVSLDRAKYNCHGMAIIQVVDCDLNTDDNTVETVSVAVASPHEPTGEVITLTESGGATALFRGMIALATEDAPSVLQISDGDVVTAKYIDADDGFGGTNVNVEDIAVIDCLPPVVLGIQAENILPYDATINFMTNELARPTVHFGQSCQTLDQTVAGEDFETDHAVHLSGLTEDTVYFYSIDIVDTVNNSTTFDGDGSCYAFSTADIPNFFTRAQDEANQLDNTLLDFTPNETIDRYDGCKVSIEALPTDPTNGTPLTLMNNSFQQVTLEGDATVLLYGVEYHSFFVGSNGYITFETGETTTTETFTQHFAQPQISALFDDLNPAVGGTVSWLQLSNRVVVTWENVPENSQPTTNTFQIEMFFDGRITIGYLGIAANDGIAGLSDGAGLNEYFSPTDFTTFGACGPRPPRARRIYSYTVVDAPVMITLEATDDGLPDPPAILTYSITSLPQDGLLSDPGAGPIDTVPYVLANHGSQLSYAPVSGDSGPDSFQYSASDGGMPPEGGDSAPANVLLQVDLDCNANGIGDPFDLMNQTSEDCNFNVVPDECDIIAGTSFDCEPNGIPDECQVDCNANGMTDACDIAGGVSADCNTNATPDECDLAGWANNQLTHNFNPPLPIAELGVTTHTIAINSEGLVVDVNVEVNITHGHVDDIFIGLRHNNGPVRKLVDHCGGDGDNFTSTRFDDDAVTPICEGLPPFFGSHKPETPLSQFNGQPIQGDWTLVVRDTAPGQTGTWINWTIHVPVGSPDCNVNLVPDECDPDCNTNDRPDDCDIDQGVSLDSNTDDVPDECQCPGTRGDLTGDTRIDLRDLSGFQNCYGLQTAFECACADMNVDAAVNSADVLPFVNAQTGP